MRLDYKQNWKKQGLKKIKNQIYDNEKNIWVTNIFLSKVMHNQKWAANKYIPQEN